MSAITSTSNERVKHVRALQTQANVRHDSGLLVIEGPNLLKEALLAGVPIKEIFFTDPAKRVGEISNLIDAARQGGAQAISVTEAIMRAMTDTKTPQGVLAVLPMPSLLPPEESTFALIIDGLSDPGNLGTIMRTAAAADVPVIYVTPGTVDVANPKVVRSAAGAHFRTPVQLLDWPDLSARLHGSVIYLADSTGGEPYSQLDWRQACALIVSGEAHGPSAKARQLAQINVTIPMPGGAESLNVAIATGILVFEMVRQRASANQKL